MAVSVSSGPRKLLRLIVFAYRSQNSRERGQRHRSPTPALPRGHWRTGIALGQGAVYLPSSINKEGYSRDSFCYRIYLAARARPPHRTRVTNRFTFVWHDARSEANASLACTCADRIEFIPSVERRRNPRPVLRQLDARGRETRGRMVMRNYAAHLAAGVYRQ